MRVGTIHGFVTATTVVRPFETSRSRGITFDGRDCFDLHVDGATREETQAIADAINAAISNARARAEEAAPAALKSAAE